MSENILEVNGLKTHFYTEAGIVLAVDGVSFNVIKGETLGLVGESGCGKSTTGRTILQLYQPTSGAVIFEGVDLVKLKTEEMRKFRRRMQMIFQDPYASLSPRMRVSSLLLEPFHIHGIAVEADQKVTELLTMVGLSAEQADKYPHELSGGQARRVGIARAWH